MSPESGKQGKRSILRERPRATPRAVALLAASTCATTVGFALPWLLARSGRDPAFGSGPIATIIQDVLSLPIDFRTVKALLF
jgi:magnesium transporter